MKLDQHYSFNVVSDSNAPFVTIYTDNRVGIWQLNPDGAVSFRIEMTFEQGMEVAHELIDRITSAKEYQNEKKARTVTGRFDEDGNFIKNVGENNV